MPNPRAKRSCLDLAKLLRGARRREFNTINYRRLAIFPNRDEGRIAITMAGAIKSCKDRSLRVATRIRSVVRRTRALEASSRGRGTGRRYRAGDADRVKTMK